MGIVDHVLIEHGVWVADNHCLPIFIRLFVFGVIEYFSSNREEHSIYFGFRIMFFIGNPPVFALEISGEDVSQLDSISE